MHETSRWRNPTHYLHRFVGLLLATKLLQSTDQDEPIREVLEALGQNFINRLLLPLTRQRQVRVFC